jgi:hypothetical protein
LEVLSFVEAVVSRSFVFSPSILQNFLFSEKKSLNSLQEKHYVSSNKKLLKNMLLIVEDDPTIRELLKDWFFGRVQCFDRTKRQGGYPTV